MSVTLAMKLTVYVRDIVIIEVIKNPTVAVSVALV